jgi:hypothetical protein
MRARGLLLTACVLGLAAPAPSAAAFEARTLDGSGNNRAHPDWGRAGTPYPRVTRPRYADGAGQPAAGPSSRYVSNRIFNDLGQDLFSPRRVSQWAWTWGQFLDHGFGLAEGGGESRPIAFDAADPLERFRNDVGPMSFRRDAAAPGTGTTAAPREQVNTVSSYIDGWAVYGGTPERLEWLREGPVNGNLADNGARLLLTPDGHLPRADARGLLSDAPAMQLDGRLRLRPQDAVVAGDARANENMALTALHTLFAREHNRIVDALPAELPAEERFQIARRVVSAEQQYITYREFLPAIGVKLPRYRGYKPNVNASISNEFASVGYRAHSMIHGEFELDSPIARWEVLLNQAYFNPDLVRTLGIGQIMLALRGEAQYRNDEQIDDALRSVLFQLPGPGARDPHSCFTDPAAAAGCFQAVMDLGALDIERGRDHGMPAYNELRRAFGLRPRKTFRAITGERSERFPRDRKVSPSRPIDDPNILDFVDVRDGAGRRVKPGGETAVAARRRTPLAARLRAVYGSVKKLDAFVGMASEPPVRGSDLGELQHAIWARQFHALRAGDRFFYRHDPALEEIRTRHGIDYRVTLGDLIVLNAGLPRRMVPGNVFFAPRPKR